MSDNSAGQLDAVLGEHSDLLRPLLLHRVQVACFVSERPDRMFNIRHYRRASINEWMELWEQLASLDVVGFFRVGGRRIPWDAVQVRSELERPTKDRDKDIWVGFTPAGGAAWERVVQLDWRSFYCIRLCSLPGGQTQVTVTTQCRTSLQQFDESRQWPASGKQLRVVSHWRAYYWRTLETAHQAIYKLAPDEFRTFLIDMEWFELPGDPEFDLPGGWDRLPTLGVRYEEPDYLDSAD